MSENKIELSGIFSDGYGFVPKKLMKTNLLSSNTKLVICYLLSYTGAGVTCFPQIKDIASHLNISTRTVIRCLDQAIAHKFINKHQENRGDKIGKKNTYELLFMYDFPKNSTTQKKASDKLACANKTVASDNPDISHVTPGNSNNNINNNNNNNNRNDDDFVDKIRNGDTEYNNIPLYLGLDRNKDIYNKRIAKEVKESEYANKYSLYILTEFFLARYKVAESYALKPETQLKYLEMFYQLLKKNSYRTIILALNLLYKYSDDFKKYKGFSIVEFSKYIDDAGDLTSSNTSGQIAHIYNSFKYKWEPTKNNESGSDYFTRIMKDKNKFVGDE